MQNHLLLNKKYFSVFIALILLISCSSSDGNSDDDLGVIPTNLVVNTEISGQSLENPYGDGSGIVKFKINATNATSYKITFGDGIVQNSASNEITYTYKASGVYSYIVNVTAYNGINAISKSVTITINVTTAPIWSDEFDANGTPNSSKWRFDIGTGSNGWGNNESQYYTNRPDNVKVENGCLKISTKKEAYQGSNYTSARLLTQGKFSIKYGKIEIRAKLPAGRGTWPALWMLGDNIDSAGWPACGEIDIMEHTGNDLNKILGTLHYSGRSGGNADSSSKIISNATTEFHIYSVDWSAESIKFYVDNQLFKNFTNTSSLPFNQRFFLIMNCAMGGNLGGAIDPNFVSSTFEIDYVRVYD
jgi:beta-glucanase (GH16 family)